MYSIIPIPVPSKSISALLARCRTSSGRAAGPGPKLKALACESSSAVAKKMFFVAPTNNTNSAVKTSIFLTIVTVNLRWKMLGSGLELGLDLECNEC